MSAQNDQQGGHREQEKSSWDDPLGGPNPVLDLQQGPRGQLLPSLPSPAVNLQPQLASVTFATNNPTLTTVALEKPLCMFDSSEPLSGSYEVYLYAMVDSGKGPASLQKRHLTVYGEEGEGGGWDVVYEGPGCPHLPLLSHTLTPLWLWPQTCPLPGWWEGATPVSQHQPSTSCLAHFRATVCKQHAGYYGRVGDEDRGGGPSLGFGQLHSDLTGL